MIVAEIVILIEDKSRIAEGKRLSEQLHLPLVSHYEPSQIVLILNQQRLELCLPSEKINPIFVDFLDKSTQLRLQKNRGRSELIARAMGVKGSYLPSIIDTTAGLGGDATILAHLGCQVKMIERSPIICALLEDGLTRARAQNPDWLPNLTLACTDAKNFLQNEIQKQNFVDVVYLDPMFPERVKTALVKKEMRVLKKIVGEDLDAEKLFLIAKQCAKKRVVIKRPVHAKPLTSEEPSIVYRGKVCRFDVYLCI